MDEYQFDYYQYLEKTNKNKNFSLLLLFLLIIFLMASYVFFNPRINNYKEFYFVQTNEFETYKDALNFSEKIKSNGVIPYVYFDKSYHILISFFSDLDKAKSFLKTIKKVYKKSNIFIINYPQIMNLKTSATELKILKKHDEKFLKTLIIFESLNNDFQTNKIAFNEVSLQIKKQQEILSNSVNDFISFFENNPKFNLAKNYALKILKSLSRINSFNEKELSNQFQYELIFLTINNTQFLSCF